MYKRVIYFLFLSTCVFIFSSNKNLTQDNNKISYEKTIVNSSGSIKSNNIKLSKDIQKNEYTKLIVWFNYEKEKKDYYKTNNFKAVDTVDISNNKEVDNYIAYKRDFAKQFYMKQNEKYINKLNLNISPEYISKYTSSVYYDLTNLSTTEINIITKQIANYNFVIKVYVKFITELQDTGYEKAVSNIIDDGDDGGGGGSTTLTGEGVKIGILDIGIIDIDDENFAGLTHTPVVRRILLYNETEEEHSTQVAAIAAGNSGIAPDARIYSVEFDYILNGYSGEIEWLLDNDVNVVNMSIGKQSICTYNGQFGDTADNAYLNSVVDYYSLTLVAATGNELDDDIDGGYVCSPASATNVISVGSVDSSGRPSYFSNYKKPASADVYTNPVISALGTVYIPWYGYYSGTSYSSPIVTGNIALFMQNNSVLKLSPAKVMSVIAASATDAQTGNFSVLVESEGEYINFPNTLRSSDGLYTRTGAGIIDKSRGLATSSLAVNVSKSSSGTVYEREVYLSSGKTINVTMAFLQKTFCYDGNYFNYSISDYDLKLVSPSGTYVVSRYSSYSNIEIARYTASSSGYYTIKVNKYHGSFDEDIAISTYYSY